MKDKILSFLAASITVCLLLTGCSAKSDTTRENVGDAPVKVDQGEGMKDNGSAENTASPAVDVGQVNYSGKKIIYTATIVVEVDDATETIKEISAAASELGGYVSDSTFNRDNDIASGTITIRIEPEQYSQLTAKIGTLGEVLESTLTSQDVTYDYVDIESRLTNAEAQEKQLLAIMDKAVLIEDILKVRTELNTVQQEIESYKGQLRYLDNMVGYSTVTIRVTEKYVPKAPEVKENEGVIARWSSSYVWKSIVKGFNNSVAFVANFFGGLMIFLSYVIIPVLIIGAVVFVLLKIRKRVRKAKGKVINPVYPSFPVAGPSPENKSGKDPKDSQKT